MSELQQLWAMFDGANIDYESTVTGAGTDEAKTLVTVCSKDITLALQFIFDRDDRLKGVSLASEGRTGG